MPDDVPLTLEFEVKAGVTASIGRTLVLQHYSGESNHNVFIRLTQTFQRFEIPIDAARAGSPPLVLCFRIDRDELVQNDLYFEN